MPRLAREARTLHFMLLLYCGAKHGGTLCPECEGLWQYARGRIERCPFQERKPTCLQCRVHCYEPAMRERIRRVMRFSGPRMLWHHPILAFFHLCDALKRPPVRV